MAQIWTMGEMIVEIMRTAVDAPLDQAGDFRGPFPSGAPAIFIDTAARLGQHAGIIGGVGRDDFGSCMLGRLRADGVDCSHVMQSCDAATGCAFVTYFSDGERKFLFHIDRTAAVQAKAPEAIDLSEETCFHIMGCSLMANADFGTEIVRAMHAFVKKGAWVSFDPNIRPEMLGNGSSRALFDEVLRNTRVLLPGVSELLSITGQSSVSDAVAQLFENSVLEIVAVKDGSRGSTIYTREKVYPIGIYPVQVLDATGAGDCFDATFLCMLLEGKGVCEAAQAASAAAALNTAAFGPMEGRITREKIRALIEKK